MKETILSEKNYDFRLRHWQYHRPGMRQIERICRSNEVMIDESWEIGCAADGGSITNIAVSDFREYLEKSMDIALPLTRKDGEKVLWVEVDNSVEHGFVIEAAENHIRIAAAEDKMSFRATIHLEDIMNLEGAPVLSCGKTVRKPLYDRRIVHSGIGLDHYPDSELLALLHAGYDMIDLFLEGIDRNHIGYCDFNDIIERADRYGIGTVFHNYIQTYIHPDADGAQELFDGVYGKILAKYPKVKQIVLCGESLEFPSKAPATSGKARRKSIVDGIPDTKPSPGWYPCYDYPAYIQCIERAIHKVNPNIDVTFSTMLNILR